MTAARQVELARPQRIANRLAQSDHPDAPVNRTIVAI